MIMTFGPEDVHRKPKEPWLVYQSRMLDLLGPEEKRAALRRRAKWRAIYKTWVSRMRACDSNWNPPAHSDTWRKWRQRKRFTPEANAVRKEWEKAHDLELLVVRPKPVRREVKPARRMIKPKRKRRMVRAKPIASEAHYATWLGTMRAKHGADWAPPTCCNTWRKWRNRRSELVG